MAHYFSFTLPRCFIRPLWLHQFDTFDTSQSCFHLMFLRYWFMSVDIISVSIGLLHTVSFMSVMCYHYRSHQGESISGELHY